MKKSRKVVIGVAVGLLGLVAAAPWLVPTSAWRVPVEKAASEAVGAPVVIGDLSIAFLPLPHLKLRDLDVGKGALKLSSARAYPALATLFSTPRHIRNVELEKLVVGPLGVELLHKLAERPSAGPAPVTLGRLHAKDVAIVLAAGPLPVVEATVELGEGNLVRTLAVKTADGKARIDAVPDGEGWKLNLNATDWQLPLGPPLKFAELKATGRTEGTRLVLPTIHARLYEGQVDGNAELDWKKGMRLAGQANATGLAIAPLVTALKLKAALSGKLDASGPFKAQAATPAALADAINADIAFNVHDGVLHGVDLASAAKSLFKGGGSGGQTRFDQLTGNVRVAGRAYHLRNVKVASGVLNAGANVDINPARQLSGRVDVDLKGTGGMVGVPLAISGTVGAPVLMPTKGSLAGAAIGSVLLPGVGTAAGSSIGDKIGKLFGK